MVNFISFSSLKQMNRLFLLTGFAIACGFILTILSLMGLCTTSCVAGKEYRIFDLPFETMGLLFFSGAALLHGMSLKYKDLIYLTALFLASGIGAEVYFILVQKFVIGSWCMVCVGVAATVSVATLCSIASVYHYTNSASSMSKRRKIMTNLRFGMSTLSMFFIGFLIAFLGVEKYNHAAEAQDSLKESIVFGNENSDIEVYVFTDWACPSCRKLEPTFKAMAPKVMKESKLYFIDYVVHPETMNYIPYNLSFMINNKNRYLILRDELTKISAETSVPTDEEVESLARSVGENYDQLNYGEVAVGIRFFKELGEKFNIKGTPTIIIINTEARKGRKLSGNSEISQENVLKAIDSLKNL